MRARLRTLAFSPTAALPPTPAALWLPAWSKAGPKEALALSPAAIVDRLENLPAAHLHCAILAVSTLHKAIADYLLQY
ncbi:MAG TPA: hypothetical protein ENN69_09105 [Spirochaetia bacterium]|nr:hypothetical protein [Spirochaetia bacterium]